MFHFYLIKLELGFLLHPCTRIPKDRGEKQSLHGYYQEFGEVGEQRREGDSETEEERCLWSKGVEKVLPNGRCKKYFRELEYFQVGRVYET